MPTRQGSSCSKNLRICTRRNVFFTTTLLAPLMPWTWKTVLARSRPIVVISIADGSFGSWLLDRFHNFGTLMPGAGAIHPICFALPKADIRSGRLTAGHSRLRLPKLVSEKLIDFRYVLGARRVGWPHL